MRVESCSNDVVLMVCSPPGLTILAVSHRSSLQRCCCENDVERSLYSRVGAVHPAECGTWLPSSTGPQSLRLGLVLAGLSDVCGQLAGFSRAPYAPSPLSVACFRLTFVVELRDWVPPCCMLLELRSCLRAEEVRKVSANEVLGSGSTKGWLSQVATRTTPYLRSMHARCAPIS